MLEKLPIGTAGLADHRTLPFPRAVGLVGKPQVPSCQLLCRKVIYPVFEKRQKSPLLSLVGLLVIFVIIAAFMPGLRRWGLRLDAIDAVNRTPEPIPGNSKVLFREDPITVLVPEMEPSKAALWFCNHGSEDTMVICRIVTVNDHEVKDASLSVSVPANSAVKSTLLEHDTIIHDIAFTMEAQTSRGEFLFETAPIQLKIE